jgi:hypothetical protein
MLPKTTSSKSSDRVLRRRALWVAFAALTGFLLAYEL